MFTKLLRLFCILSLFAAQSAFSDEEWDPEKEWFPVPRAQSAPEEKNYQCTKPRLCHFVIPTGVAAIGLAIGAYKATECDDCEPTQPTPVIPSDVLNFFVEAALGFGSESSGGGITVEIEFPDMSLLDTISFSTETSGIFTELSNSTTDFSSGDQFTVNVTSVTYAADNLEVTMRINGIDIITQAQSDPTTSTSFVFTIP